MRIALDMCIRIMFRCVCVVLSIRNEFVVFIHRCAACSACFVSSTRSRCNISIGNRIKTMVPHHFASAFYFFFGVGLLESLLRFSLSISRMQAHAQYSAIFVYHIHIVRTAKGEIHLQAHGARIQQWCVLRSPIPNRRRCCVRDESERAPVYVCVGCVFTRFSFVHCFVAYCLSHRLLTMPLDPVWWWILSASLTQCARGLMQYTNVE